MKVTINGVVYENVTWNGNGFFMETEMTLAEIEEAFTPGANANIIVEEGSQEIARYYNKGIDRISVSGNNPRTVDVQFSLTQISVNAETEIRESIEDSDEAIIELAQLFSTFAESDLVKLYNEIQTYFTNRLREEDNIFQQIEIRLQALEHALGIVSINPTESEEEQHG